MIMLAILGLAAGGFIVFRTLSKPVSPAPPEVARDPLLSQGRIIFLCVAWHAMGTTVEATVRLPLN